MRNLLFSLGLLFSTISSAAVYYTCGTANGSNLTSLSDGTGSCNIIEATWNQVGNEIFVRSGNILNLSGEPFNLLCKIEVLNGGTLDFNSGLSSNNINNAFNIQSGATVSVNGTFLISSNNTALNIKLNGLLLVNSPGTVSNNVTGNSDITVNGNISGSGVIDFKGNLSGSGTINGQPVSPPPTSPIDLTTVGIVWDGASWSPGAPSNLIDRAIFKGNYFFIKI